MSQDAGKRFRICREAGRGKRAVVLEAIDTLLHRPVALKLARSGTGNRFLLEEGQRLARVRSPYVATLHDILPDNGGLVLEWLSGQTLRQRLGKSAPLPFDKLSLWTGQLLTAVAAAHSVDVLHGDIKPENIWIDENDQLKLFDFGMTPRPGGDATALYAPAEILRGEKHSTQSDLYCVGGVVFEMLTGHLPFDSSDADELAQRKSRSAVPRVSRCGGSANEQVEAWIARALHKDPQHRFENAAAAGEAWQRAALSMKRPAPQTMASGILHPQILAELVDIFTDSGYSQGSVVTLTGATGLGKSELLRQLARRLPDSISTIVLSGALENQQALSTWREAMYPRNSPVATCSSIVEVVSALELRLHDQDDARNILILVDDFALCDSQSRSLLLQLARQANRLRIGMLAATRQSHLGDALSDWCALQDAATRALGLAIPDAEMLRRVLVEPGEKTEIPDALVAYVYVVSGGNPRYASHVMDDLRSQGFILQTDKSLSFAVPAEDRIPERSRPYLERSLGSLSATQRRLLVEASLHGVTFTAEQLAHRVDLPSTLIKQQLHELIQQTDLLAIENHLVHFVTPLLQRFLEDTLAPELRQKAHHDISNWLLAQAEKDPGSLGMHLFGADRLAEARQYLSKAGRAALDQHELESARRYLHLALRCIDTEPTNEEDASSLVELLLLQAQTLSKMASWEDAFALIDRCLLQAQAWGLPQQEVQAIRWRGRIQYEQGRFEVAVHTLRQAQDLAAQTQDQAEAHELALQIGNIDFELGRSDAALAGYMSTLLFATENKNLELEARASNNVALVHSTTGNKPEAIQMFSRSLKLFRRLQRADAVARTLHNIGMTYLDLHNWSEARNYFQESIELSVRLGLDEIASVSRLEYAETNLRLGRVEEAKPDIDKALAQCQQRNDPLGTATAYRLQAMVATLEGDRQKAESRLEQSINLLRELGKTPHLGVALKERGRWRLEAGDTAGARSALEEAREIFESLEARHEGLAEVKALWELCLKASV